MINVFFKVFFSIFQVLSIVLVPLGLFILLFSLVCFVWFIFYYIKGKRLNPSGQIRVKEDSFLKQFFIDIPKRFVLDLYNRETDYFYPMGIHMFCGEQGSGKTISCTRMIKYLQTRYPKVKVITNFGLTTENDELTDWHQILDYTNGHKGVIVGIDEIQNWFMSGLNQLPEGMLEVATQNRKNNRIILCTAQVFTRVNKGLREQVTMVYNPHTFLRCFTVVVKRKPEFDDEGNVKKMKYKGMYCFTHTDDLRESYDTYKVIHTLSKEGFKEQAQQPITQIRIIDKKK